MSKRLLFIGQAPSRESDGQPPFTGRCGAFLAELMGITQEQMLKDHDFVNVLNRWPGKGINGDLFPIVPARQEVNQRILPLIPGRTTILLGRNVTRAFNINKFEYGTWYELRDPSNAAIVFTRRMAIIPHPSGVNRWWNVRGRREFAKKWFEGVLRP